FARILIKGKATDRNIIKTDSSARGNIQRPAGAGHLNIIPTCNIHRVPRRNSLSITTVRLYIPAPAGGRG
ncbi:hypothetical protein NGZ29_005483, partial [Salmonella enterica]|nr:hypothetical protein [Salmonella enterica]